MSAPHAQAILANAISRSVNEAIRGHRQYVQTVTDQTVKDGSCLGFVELDGPGEATIDITFPLRFFERPLFTAGLELRDNSFLTWGAFPTWSATIVRFNTEAINPDTILYVGAQLAIVTTNVNRSALHYSFQAKAFTNPSGPDDSVNGPM